MRFAGTAGVAPTGVSLSGKTRARQIELLRCSSRGSRLGRRGRKRSGGERHRLRVRNLPFDQQTTFLRAIGRLVQSLQLQVRVLNGLQISLQL
jgi:hypothetical protein